MYFRQAGRCTVVTNGKSMVVVVIAVSSRSDVCRWERGRSDMELTKIRRGRLQSNGRPSLSQRRVRSNPRSKWWPGTPRNRSAKVRA
jgi:hypothetical protein